MSRRDKELMKKRDSGSSSDAGEVIGRAALFDVDDKPIATMTSDMLDTRAAFIGYGLIIPAQIPAPMRDDLHSICVYYKARESGEKISFKDARKITAQMKE